MESFAAPPRPHHPSPTNPAEPVFASSSALAPLRERLPASTLTTCPLSTTSGSLAARVDHDGRPSWNPSIRKEIGGPEQAPRSVYESDSAAALPARHEPGDRQARSRPHSCVRRRTRVCPTPSGDGLMVAPRPRSVFSRSGGSGLGPLRPLSRAERSILKPDLSSDSPTDESLPSPSDTLAYKAHREGARDATLHGHSLQTRLATRQPDVTTQGPSAPKGISA